MNCAKRRIVIKALAALALSSSCALSWAAVAGSVVNLSGPLMAKKADGSVKVLGVKSEVEEGDTLVAEKNTYAQIKLIDNSEITLRPSTTFMIEKFAYDEAKPEADNATFNLLKGGLRSITGLLGKRNKEKFLMKTPTATIGIRGTTFIIQYVAPNTPRPPAPSGAPRAIGGGSLQPGLHLFVSEGIIFVGNQGGSQLFSQGQFGFASSATQIPRLMPTNENLIFELPRSFSPSLTEGAKSTTGGAAVDCEVR